MAALDREGIKAIIPHREPFLLVDRIEDYVPGESAIGYLDVTADMFWVRGHFPDHAVMPGVLIVEACAQVGSVALLSLPENRGKIGFFGGIDGVRFKRQVRPGDTLRLECRITKRRGPIGFGEAKAWVGDQLACAGELMFAIQRDE
jgi:3-hydroxyacyl-[acyl-carrier-protein] dehydratase